MNATTGIRQRGKTWQVIVTRPDGSQYTKTAPNVTEAKRLRGRMLTEVADGMNVASKYSLRDYYTKVWMPALEARVAADTFRKPTIATYKTAMTVHWLPALGSKKLGALTAPDIKRARDNFKTKAGEPLARSTLITMMNSLKSMLTHAMGEGLLTVNPACSVPAPHLPNNREKPLRMLTESDVSLFLSHVDPHYHTFFATLAATALRISEIVALRWCDVEQDRIHVRQRFAYAEMKPPKSGKSRFIPITEELHEALTIWHKETRWQEPEHLVFCYAGWSGSGTRPMDDSHLSKNVLHPTMVKAGLEPMGFHAFRHGAATTWFNRGMSLEDCSVLLGHSSPQITWACYQHVMPDDLCKRAAKFLGRTVPTTDREVVPV